MVHHRINTQVVVLGAGPGGYSAAFRCADLGMKTVIVENNISLGGVCLNFGCIPSKSLLHFAKILKEVKLFTNLGVTTGDLKVNINKLRFWKEGIINKFTVGLSNIARLRKIKVINGFGKFINSNVLEVIKEGVIYEIIFNYAIIATGSKPMQLSCISENDSRVWNSTDALELNNIPNKLLIIGSGVIGLEIATIYHALGSNIDLVEVSDDFVFSLDKDISRIFFGLINNQFNLILGTKVTMVQFTKEIIFVKMEKIDGSQLIPNSSSYIKTYDCVLVAIGRSPNSEGLGVDLLGIEVNSRGFISVNNQMRTNIPHIFAVGDVVGNPMLAHKGIHEGRLAAEVISGRDCFFNPKVIPFIIYTDPELAWVGLTEKSAQEKKIRYESVIFPWSALGRAVINSCQQGLTKLIFNKDTNKVIGGTVIGVNGGELLGEIALAIESGCDVETIATTIHAHPTLYESVGSASLMYNGSVTDILNKKINQ